MSDLNQIDFNLGDYDHRTPLHVAVVSGKLETVKYLVEVWNVDVSPIDRWGTTPLSDAIMLKQYEI